MTYNTAIRNALATAYGDLFASGTIEIRTATGAALLATISLPASPFGAPASGVISKSGTWSVVATGSGIARIARFISSDTLKVADVSITEAGGGGELIIDNEDILLGGTVTVTAYTYTVPAS